MINKPAVITFLSIFFIQLLFLILKFVNVITWSWMWILAPLWMPYFLFVAIMIFTVIYMAISVAIEKMFHTSGGE